MTTMPASYYNNFDASKNYERVLYRDGYTLQGTKLNEPQSASQYRLRSVADALFKDGDIIRDAQVVIDEAGKVKASSGAIYLADAVRGLAPKTFTIPTTGTVYIGVRLVEKVISEKNDKKLYNPAVGSRGEGEAGAWRLQVTPEWVMMPVLAKRIFIPCTPLTTVLFGPKKHRQRSTPLRKVWHVTTAILRAAVPMFPTVCRLFRAKYPVIHKSLPCPLAAHG